MSRKVELKSDAELQKMRTSGILLRQVFNEIGKNVAPGVSTAELDRVARKCIEAGGARPAFLGYMGYPATLCTSVNEEVVHGIPSSRRLNEGDIVSVDCGLVLSGFYADTATTYAVGQISAEATALLEATQESLNCAIEQMVVGNRIGTVSAAVQHYVEQRGYSVVRDYTGHGIGRAMHEPPQMPNFGDPDTGFRLRPGLVLAIEPMVNVGTFKTKTLKDGWTVITADGKLSAHFEHTVAVTEAGPMILTL
jgi:methionyl aminopeptidase